MKTKVEPRCIHVKGFPTIIVGQNPGHFKDGSTTGIAWEKNRSAKLLEEIIEYRQNLILTNICNYPDMTDEHLDEGGEELMLLIEKARPTKVIALGVLAQAFLDAQQLNCRLYKLPHPSYILRFNKNKEEYINEFRRVLDS